MTEPKTSDAYPFIPPPSVDPTVLTTEALRREVQLLEKALTQRLDALHETFEHARIDHQERHERDHEDVVAAALHLEEEVANTAHRAAEAVVDAREALQKVADLHRDAHDKEHQAHENVHKAEAAQVKTAEQVASRQADVLSANLSQYKAEANEWRSTLRDQNQLFLRKDEANITFNSLIEGRQANADAIVALREVVLTTFSKQGGKTEGVSDSAKVAYMAVTAVAVVIGIVSSVIAFVH